jgi:hypothetical protein
LRRARRAGGPGERKAIQIDRDQQHVVHQLALGRKGAWLQVPAGNPVADFH